MTWTELLKAELEHTYATTDRLMAMVDDGCMNWKPSSGNNWMTTAQLLKHLTESCGLAFRGFVTGDWGMPEGMGEEAMSQLPTAEQLPGIASLAEARKALASDKQAAFDILATCTEDRLNNEKAPAPWDPTPMSLGHRLLQMVDHLKQHKGQLFYYLKLQGRPVNTGDLWGA